MISRANELPKVPKEHAAQFHENPKSFMTFEILIDVIPVLT